MTNHRLPHWLWVTGGFGAAVPFAGFLVDLLETEYFKQYVAQFMIDIVESLGTALVHAVVQSIFYGGG